MKKRITHLKKFPVLLTVILVVSLCLVQSAKALSTGFETVHNCSEHEIDESYETNEIFNNNNRWTVHAGSAHEIARKLWELKFPVIGDNGWRGHQANHVTYAVGLSYQEANQTTYITVASNEIYIDWGLIQDNVTRFARESSIEGALSLCIVTGIRNNVEYPHNGLDVMRLALPARPNSGFHAEMAIVRSLGFDLHPLHYFDHPYVHIAANRPYCSHCWLYLNNQNHRYGLMANFTNWNNNPDNFHHPVELNHNLSRYGTRLNNEMYECQDDHAWIGRNRNNTRNGWRIGHVDDEEHDEIGPFEIVIRPNVISDGSEVNLECSNCKTAQEFIVYDNKGAFVKKILWDSEFVDAIKINLSDLNKGIYYLKTQSDSDPGKSLKFIIK